MLCHGTHIHGISGKTCVYAYVPCSLNDGAAVGPAEAVGGSGAQNDKSFMRGSQQNSAAKMERTSRKKTASANFADPSNSTIIIRSARFIVYLLSLARSRTQPWQVFFGILSC